jgi:hypothetical protein
MALPRTGLGLRDIFTRSYMADPDWRSTGKTSTPAGWLFRSSPIINAVSQVAPRWMGGLGGKRMSDFDLARQQDPKLRQSTLRVGDYPELDGVQGLRSGTLPDLTRRGAQFAGAAAKDLTTQGLQNIWWFLNAYEAASMMAGRQGYHGALGSRLLPWEKEITGGPKGAPFSRSALRFASVFPLAVGAGVATGTLIRQPGYEAVLPSSEDRRETENPLSETVMRAVGRSGKLLPYDEFVKERPDVSRGDYEAYKAFLFGDKSLIKATADGIHGPEINFVGKSVPLLTGVLPVLGGIAAGRAGLRFAGKRLAAAPGGNRFGQLTALEKRVRQLDADLTVAKQGYGKRTVAEVERDRAEAVGQHAAKLNEVEGALLTGALAGSASGLTVTAAAANLLEQMRRAAAAEESRRKAAEGQLAAVETQQALPI